MTPDAAIWNDMKRETEVLAGRLALVGLTNAEADAVMEETVIRAVRARAWELPLSLDVWMFGTAVRVAAWRREQRGQPAERPEVLSPSRTEAAGVGLTTLKALDALPFRARVVLVGIDVAGYAVEEIAHVMGIDAHEAEGLLEDARARFAAALDR